MKRDINLVREILLRLEPLPANFYNPVPLTIGEPPLDIPGYTNEEIVYHFLIMAQGGLIQHSGLQGPGNIRIPRFGGLRWMGHEFLDDVRDPDTWADTKKKMSKVGSVSLQVALEVARAYLRAHLPF
jgi:hypothetical protein